MVEIATSILNVNPEETIKTFYNLETAKTDFFHIDVMDGKFVEQDTTLKMQEYANQLKQITNLPLDVHLMVEDVKTYLDAFFPFEPNNITFHLEACKNKEEVIALLQYVKENHCKVGIAIKPNTKVEELLPYLPYIHLVLIMTVEPGYGGQKLIPETIEKVKKIKQYVDENNIDIDIEVDGGVNLENCKTLIGAGANILVAGSSILHSQDFKETITKLKEI